jgi:hypothetical protein
MVYIYRRKVQTEHNRKVRRVLVDALHRTLLRSSTTISRHSTHRNVCSRILHALAQFLTDLTLTTKLTNHHCPCSQPIPRIPSKPRSRALNLYSVMFRSDHIQSVPFAEITLSASLQFVFQTGDCAVLSKWTSREMRIMILSELN